jgi:hypothetical protein
MVLVPVQVGSNDVINTLLMGCCYEMRMLCFRCLKGEEIENTRGFLYIMIQSENEIEWALHEGISSSQNYILLIAASLIL